MDVQPSSGLLLLCELLQLIERIQQRFVVVELEQFLVIQFVMVLQWIVERIFQRFVQRAFEFSSFFISAIFVSAVIKRGGTEQ